MKLIVFALCIAAGAAAQNLDTRSIAPTDPVGGSSPGKLCDNGSWSGDGRVTPWTCSGGRSWNSIDVAGLYSKLTYDQLASYNMNLTALSATITDLTNAVKDLTTKTQQTTDSIDKQSRGVNELLQTVIIKRFDAIPADLLTNQAFKDALDKLKTDILAEVEKRLPKPAPTPAPPR